MYIGSIYGLLMVDKRRKLRLMSFLLLSIYLWCSPVLSFSSIPGFTVFADNFNVFVPTKSDDWEAERKNLNRSVEKI